MDKLGCTILASNLRYLRLTHEPLAARVGLVGGELYDRITGKPLTHEIEVAGEIWGVDQVRAVFDRINTAAERLKEARIRGGFSDE